MPTTGIVAFAFGVPANTATNRRLAKIASAYAERFGIPIFTQRDIVPEEGFDVTRIQENESPASTLAIARGAIAWARERQIETVWVVAALPHLWRCQRDLYAAGKEANYGLVQRIPTEVSRSLYGSWFDPSSTQPRVRSFWKWIARESVLHLMPFPIYARVAK